MPEIVSAADLTTRYDARSIAALASDTGTPIWTDDIANDMKVLTAIDDAEGNVFGYLMSNGRYTVEQLAALEGSRLAYLKRIICDMAMLHLLQRRPKVDEALFNQLRAVVDDHIKQIKNGESILQNDDRSLDSTRVSVDGVSYQDLAQKNSVRIRTQRYFGLPELPRGR